MLDHDAAVGTGQLLLVLLVFAEPCAETLRRVSHPIHMAVQRSGTPPTV